MHRYEVELKQRRAELQQAELERQRESARGFTADRETKYARPAESVGNELVLDGHGDLLTLAAVTGEEDAQCTVNEEK
tara:strand:+ start:89 stop:322 length:234 start_codon:yes stop_codon:yes gene_type:complete